MSPTKWRDGLKNRPRQGSENKRVKDRSGNPFRRKDWERIARPRRGFPKKKL